MAEESQRKLNWAEYGCEALGTALLCFFGLSAVTLDFGAGSPVAGLITSPNIRLLLTGLLFAGSGSLITVSPIGKRSGAHLNPSVTLAFWIRGKMHWHDTVMYMAAQFTGAYVGCIFLKIVWGGNAETVSYGMTVPGKDYGPWLAFAAEFLMTGVYLTLILLFVSSQRLMRKTPLMNWIVIATFVWVEAPISGTSLNAARSFGPALVADDWNSQWLYFISPALGASAAALLFPLIHNQERRILTGKLFHADDYPNLFKDVPEKLEETGERY